MKTVEKMAAALLFMSALAGPALSAETREGPNRSDAMAEPNARGKAVEQLALGYELADYARTAQDAQAMLVAAKMVAAVPTKPGTEKGTLSGENKGATGTAKAIKAADLFTEARTLAKGDQDLLGQIEDAQAAGTKGRVEGPLEMVQYVPAQTVWTVPINAYGNEKLVVAAGRDAQTPVDLRVLDERGREVCSDGSHAVVMSCTIVPAWTGRFTLEVTNHGAQGSAIALLTN